MLLLQTQSVPTCSSKQKPTSHFLAKAIHCVKKGCLQLHAMPQNSLAQAHVASTWQTEACCVRCNAAPGSPEVVLVLLCHMP